MVVISELSVICMRQEMEVNKDSPTNVAKDWRDYTDRLNMFLWNYQWYKYCVQVQYQSWISAYSTPASLPYYHQMQSMQQQQQQAVASQQQQIPPHAIPTYMLANVIAQELNAQNAAPTDNTTGGNRQPNRQIIHMPAGLGMTMSIQTQRFNGTIFRLPSYTRRMLAEVVDTLVILLIKLVVTMFISDYFGIIDLDTVERLVFEKFDLANEDIGQLISDLLIWEVIHRLTSCLFEAAFIARNAGATPGKQLLALRVVSYERVMRLGSERVIVHNCKFPGFTQALVRSFVKHFSMAFLLPTPVTILFHPLGLAIHDSISRCIVVRDPSDAPAFENNNNNNRNVIIQ